MLRSAGLAWVLAGTLASTPALHFEEVSYGLRETTFTTVAVHPSDVEVALVGGLGGLYRTDDGGESWQNVLFLPTVDVVDIEDSSVTGEERDEDSVGADPLDGTIVEGQAEVPTEEGAEEANTLQSSEPAQAVADAVLGDVEASGDEFSGVQSDDLTEELRDLAEVGDVDAEELLRPKGVRVIAFSPHDSRAVWAGTHVGLYRSLDAGRSFEQMDVGAGDAEYVQDIAFDPRAPKAVYLATLEGLVMSLDGGTTWTNQGAPAGRGAGTAVLVGPSGAPWIATEAGVFEFDGTGFVLRFARADVGAGVVRRMRWLPGLREGTGSTSAGQTPSPRASGSATPGIPEETPELPSPGDTATPLPAPGPAPAAEVDAAASRAYGGPGRVVLVTSSGLFVGVGEGFASAQVEGLEGSPMDLIALKDGTVVVATSTGVYRGDASLTRFAAIDPEAPFDAPRGVGVCEAAPEAMWAVTATRVLHRMPARSMALEGAGRSLVIDFLQKEPTASEVARAALHAHALDGRDPGANINLSALLPRLTTRLSVNRSHRTFAGDDALFVVFTTDDLEDPTQLQIYEVGDGSIYDSERTAFVALARWDLMDLVYSRNEAPLNRERKRLYEERDRLLSEVIGLYHQRQRLIVQLVASGSVRAAELARRELQLEEIDGQLDGQTGGWFGEERTRRGAPSLAGLLSGML